MARYEVADGQAHKFWEILLEGPTYRIRFGRMGTNGQGQVKRFGSPDEARRAHDKIVGEKLRKGYKLVDGLPPASASPSLEDHLEPALEAAIADRPDDLDAYAVYADWLQQQGDPRGELMGMNVAMRRQKDPVEFLALKRALAPIEALKPAFLGESLVARGHELRVEWELGLVRKATIELRGSRDGADLLGELAARPVGRLIRELVAKGPGAAGVLRAVADGATPALRSITIHDPELETSYDGVWAGAPRLEQVGDRGRLSLGEIDAPALRSLVVVGIDAPSIASLARGKLPRLERLVLTSDGDALGPLATASLPALTSLTIHGTGGAYGPFVRALTAGPLAHRLRELFLVALLDDESAEALIRARPRLSAIQHLRVGGPRAEDVKRAFFGR